MDKKVERIMSLYTRLLKGNVISKDEESKRFNVNKKTIQRDIDDIRAYLANNFESNKELVYERKINAYRLTNINDENFTNSEIFTVCKILLESRALVNEEMMPIIDKLLRMCSPEKYKKRISELISNEKFHYLEPHHGQKFVERMWDISDAVYNHKLMRIRYNKLKEIDAVKRMIQPVGIMFSEYYFYLCAYISVSEEMPDVPKRPFPTIYRIDRIVEYEVLEETFRVPYADRFEEGEFRKRVQFMFGGELRTIRFLYKGLSIESVLDRFPTAEITKHNENGWYITAEVYGDGVDMWLRGQGNTIEMLNDKKEKGGN